MLEILKAIIPYLGGAIGGIILLVLLREAWRSWKKSRTRVKEERCMDLIKRVHHLTPEGLAAVALELKKSFPMEVVEAVLDQQREALDSSRDDSRQFANLYDHLGLVEERCKKMKEAKSWPDRAAAAEKLGFIGHPSAVLPLIATLRDPEEEREVKSVAMKSLGKIRDSRAIFPLIEALGSPDPATGQPLADVLVQFGKETLSALTEVIKTSTSEPQRVWACRILGRLGQPEVVSILIHALSDHGEKVREAATGSLGQLKNRRGVRPLNELLSHDPSSLVRESAAEALGKIGDEKAIEFLKRGLGDLEYAARLKAMEALEAMGEKVLPIFKETLKSGDASARAQAAAALERAGVVGRSIEDLKDQERSGEAFQLLLQIAQTGVGETLIRHLNHSDFRIRVKLCEIIRESRYPRALEPLLEIAQKDPEWPVRLHALKAIVALGDEKALPVIVRSLKKEDEETKAPILEALLKLPQRQLAQILPDVTPFLHDSNFEVRLAAVRLAALISSSQATLPLLSSLKDPYEQVRAVAAGGLGNLAREAHPVKGGAKESIVDALIGALKDPNETVRLNAVKGLGILKDRKAVPALVESFEWADEASRDLIAQAISQVPTEEIFDLIDELMGFLHPKPRAGIAWTLGLLSEEKALSLASLFLEDKEAIVRAAAVGGIGNWFERRQAYPPQPPLKLRGGKGGDIDLRNYLADPNERVRAAVCNALAKIGDSSAIEPLRELLKNEPDKFVAQRIVLAVGCLAARDESDVSKWLEREDDEVSKVAGMIALVLMGAQEGFQEGVGILQSPSKTKILKALLKSIPERFERLFFKNLSFERDLFWKEEIGVAEVARHYEKLLATSRGINERKRALAALGELKTPAILPAVEASFREDPDPTVRAQALNILTQRLDGAPLLDMILKGIQDPSEKVRSQIVPILSKIPPQELKGNRERLIPLLDSALEAIRSSVAELLAPLYRDDWKTLADELMGTSRKSRVLGLIETLGRIGNPSSADLFSRFLESKETEIREVSVHWAQEAGLLSEELLAKLLEDPRESVRASAVRGLGRQLKSGSLELLVPRAQDPSTRVRTELSLALGRSKLTEDKRPIELLERLIQDLNPQVRIQALVSLFRLGVSGGGIAKRAESMISDLDRNEREELLQRLDREGVLLELTSKLAHERNTHVRRESLEFLATLDLTRFRQEIAESLQDPSSEVRIAAVEALGLLEDSEIRKRIEDLLHDPIEAVRLAVKRRKLRTVK